MIPLKRLTLVDRDFPLSGSAVVEALRASGTKKFKCNDVTPQWGASERRELEELGYQLYMRERNCLIHLSANGGLMGTKLM